MRMYSIGLFGMFWLLASPASAAVSCATAIDDAQAFGDDLARLQAFITQVDRDCRHGDVSKTTGDVLGRAHFDAFRAATDEDARVHHVKSAILYLQNSRWQAHAAYGELLQKQRDYDAAAKQYQLALVHLQENPQIIPPTDAVKWLLDRAQATRALMPTYTRATRTRNGDPGGLTARSVGGVQIDEVPFPVEFELEKFDLTERGRLVVQDMHEILVKQQPDRITLVGHTDPSGAEAFNDALSVKRASAVRDALIALGVGFEIAVRGAGEREPPDLDDVSLYSEAELHQIMRRVVIDRTGGGS